MLVTVDVALFTPRQVRLHVVLVERGNDPYAGAWALPGGFVEIDEDLTAAAVRELMEETSLHVPIEALAQVGAYGAPGRDPRGRVVSVAYWALVEDLGAPTPGSDAAGCDLVPVDEALAHPERLAFDHHLILSDAVAAMGH